MSNIYPLIRFNSYKDCWGKCELESFVKFSKGKGYAKKDVLEDATYEILLYGMLYTDYKTRIESTKQYADLIPGSVISKGKEVVIPSSGETSEDIARASAILVEDIILGGDLNVLTVKTEELSTDFLALQLTFGSINKELVKRAQGHSVVHLYNSDLKKIKIFLPTLEEQTKIGQFFKEIDELIELQQLTIDNLVQMKKGFLQKMLIDRNEKKPVLRNGGFSNQWQKKKISEISSIVSGGTPSTKIKEYWDGTVNWFTPSEIGKSVYAFESTRKITELGLQKSSAKLLPANKTILFTSRAGIGDMAILREKSSTNQGFQSLVLHEDIEVYFIYSMGDIIKRKAIRYAAGSTFLEISGGELGGISILIPDREEQKKIGEFFKQIDELIELEEQELKSLQELKKGFLQKMFV